MPPSAGAPLTVASVAYPFAPVGPDAVGGAEQVLTTLDAALVRAGHRSIVVACEGSRAAGELVTVPRAQGGIDEATRVRTYGAMRAVLRNVATRADVVHLHGIDFCRYLPPPGPPVLATLHLPPDWYSAEALAPARPRTFLHGVSAAQHRALAGRPCVLPPIANGVPAAVLGAAHHARRDFALMLGRVCPEKGQHLALQAAHAADCALLIGGAVFPYESHETYFTNEVAPLLDRRRRFLGPLGFARKRRLLAAARCLLVPSLAAETSSLVAMEALACGTPVIAFAAGALPDIVEDGRTGFLVASADAMASAIGRAGEIDPDACRAAAQERFSAERMVDDYLALYRRLARC